MHNIAKPDTRLFFPRQRLFRLASLFLACTVLCFPDFDVWAQENAAETPGNAKTPANGALADPGQAAQIDQPIPLDQVSNRAETIGAELDILLPRKNSRKVLEQVSSETDRTLKEIKSYLAKTPNTLAGQPNIRVLQRFESKLNEMLKDLRSLAEELEDQLEDLSESLAQVDRISAVWKATDELAKTQEGAEATTITRIGAVRAAIAQARSTIVKRRNDVLALRDKLVNPSVALSEGAEKLQSEVDTRVEGIFQADHPPLWSPLVRESIRKEWQTLGPQQLLQRFNENRQDTRTLGFQVILFVALGLGLRWLRNRTRARIVNVQHQRQAHAQLVFEHPWAMSVLITATLTIPLHPTSPRTAGLIAAAIMAIATIRIVLRFMPSAMAPLVWGFAILFTIDRGRDLLDTTPTLERLVFMGELVGGLSLLIWLLRPSQIAKLPENWRSYPFVKFIHFAMRVGAVLVMLAILADLAGWSDLAVLLGGIALRSGYLGLLIFVLLKVFYGLATFAIVLRPLRLIRAISNHREFVDQLLQRILSVLAVCLWASLVCGQLGLLAPATDLVKLILNASITTGALSVSIADVLVFIFTIWLSFVLARFVQVILQEDVFTRVRMARGLPNAISNLARYTLIFIGFMFGLSAAGIEITKLAVIAGGLGVGIGFGLQNVVNNFVSGLILLFERPIDVGDTIDLTDTSGIMKRIGIRASVIRTFDGAEVIVPNGMLISDRVINWTLSDRRRRIVMDVGVEYGTPAQRVIDLLVEVAKANPKILSDPEPHAFFVNFGDSSLDFKLRAWINVHDGSFSNSHLAMRSELAIAIQQALEEAKIGVPFPQRDLHLISTPPNLAAELDTTKPQSDSRNEK
ncbi:mechanosensitive ion channel domain-containing protein [uncultured Gimesia sp.]|uniref:mechanosensitive ion channel domain-containing protein n=1 Tax=uncultured Gimesia sp. TaxID=1678688 RepID=UPI00260CC91B|nr:mechanosensitive ion channel domain-containing protein [uncultured Gimesia sp.]